MKQNTVILPLEEYNKLRDFKKKTLAGDVIIIHSLRNGDYSIISKDEAIEKLAIENELIKQFEAITVAKHNELVDVKKMSWFQFRKWRKQ